MTSKSIERLQEHGLLPGLNEEAIKGLDLEGQQILEKFCAELERQLNAPKKKRRKRA